MKRQGEGQRGMTAQVSQELVKRLRALLRDAGYGSRVALKIEGDSVLMLVPRTAQVACARVRGLGADQLVLDLARAASVWVRRLGPVGSERLLAALPSFLPWALIKLGQARCPSCDRLRSLASEQYLHEAAWRLTRTHPTGFPAGWHELRAREPGFRWACSQCIEAGVALPAEPGLQVVGLHGPALAYFPVVTTCRQCGSDFTFEAAEQRIFYEERRRSLESTEQRCEPCRQQRGGRRRSRSSP
jgi:hypothetical protein